MTILAIMIIIATTVWLISKKNSFVILTTEIQRCMSEVNTAKAKYLAVQKRVVGLAGKATNNEGKVYEKIRSSGGKISSNMLLSLGQMYPDLKDKFDMAATLSENLYDTYREAQTNLNDAISDYNKAISVFPASVVAYLFGYEPEELIDQENLKSSKTLKMESEMDLDEWI